MSSRESPKNPSLWEPVERSRPYLDLAADALRQLDSGNRVIERCVEYLSQLALALAALGRFLPLFAYSLVVFLS